MQDIQNCDFHGYDEDKLMKETANYVRLLQRGGYTRNPNSTCCSTTSVRYIKFRNTMKGFTSRTLAKRLNELDER